MKCETMFVGPGVMAIVCGRRQPRKRCSTPGCGALADLECDWAVAGRPKPTPKRGDARVHRKHGIVFYVHEVQTNPDDPDDHLICIATSQPGARPIKSPQTVTEEDWYFKTDATCDRPVCRRCAVRSGTLDFCAAHGRELAKQEKASDR